MFQTTPFKKNHINQPHMFPSAIFLRITYINIKGYIANKKYIFFFSLFTLIPSLLISFFSLFIFSFALEKYFDNKITTAVNNSYEIAKNYVDEKRNKIESDIILIAFVVLLFYIYKKKVVKSNVIIFNKNFLFTLIV